MASVGEPGKPGEAPVGTHGGRGGEGGAGGRGGSGEPRGAGGSGGHGGAGGRGQDTQAESEFRGRVNYLSQRFALVFYVIMSASVIGLFALQGHAINETCRDGQQNRSLIRDTVIDGLGPLGARYDAETDRVVLTDKPPLDYYLTHPEERQAAITQAQRTLNRFPAITCGSHINNIW